jgi:hypothetical protein
MHRLIGSSDIPRRDTKPYQNQPASQLAKKFFPKILNKQMLTATSILRSRTAVRVVAPDPSLHIAGAGGEQAADW